MLSLLHAVCLKVLVFFFSLLPTHIKTVEIGGRVQQFIILIFFALRFYQCSPDPESIPCPWLASRCSIQTQLPSNSADYHPHPQPADVPSRTGKTIRDYVGYLLVVNTSQDIPYQSRKGQHRKKAAQSPRIHYLTYQITRLFCLYCIQFSAYSPITGRKTALQQRQHVHFYVIHSSVAHNIRVRDGSALTALCGCDEKM